jgi:hypothetical protein
MDRRRAALHSIVLVIASSLVGCDSPRETPSKVTGLWSVYRTFDGSVEGGPDVTSWTSGPESAIRMDGVCTRGLDLWGNIQGDQLTLRSASAQWAGTVEGDSMQGTFTGASGSGTWRAVRTAAETCTVYEVWATGVNPLHCGDLNAYNPETVAGFTLLGTATSTHTFAASASFLQYIVVTRDMNVAHVDAVRCSDGAYYGTNNTGNTSDYLLIGGPPDGRAANVGTGFIGGYFTIDPAAATTSITVYIAPSG